MNNTSPTIGSNNASSSTTKEVPSKQEGIAICSVFVLEAVLIVLGNLLTIVLFALNKELRKKSLYLVINMAFADFILGAVSIPSLIYAIGGEYYLWTATENWFFYTFFNVLDAVFFQVSLSSAALISVERCYAIYWPLKHRTLSKRTYRITIFKAWILSIVVSTIFYVLSVLTSDKHVIYAMSSYFLILLFIVCGCYLSIWRKFQKRTSSLQQNRALQNKRLTTTLLLVSAVALLSWLPLLIMNSAVRFDSDLTVSPIAFYIAVVLTYSNSFLNPIVYALRIPEFSHALRLCCFNSEPERRDSRAVALMPVLQQETLLSDP